MNKDILKGKWSQLIGQIQEKWSKITEDDLNHIAGKYDNMVGVLQERYGYTKEEAKNEFNSFYEEATAKAHEMQNEVTAKISEGIQDASEHINNFAKKSPWSIAGISAVIGFVLGMCLMK